MSRRRRVLLSAGALVALMVIGVFGVHAVTSRGAPMPTPPAVQPQNFLWLADGSSFQDACAVLGEPSWHYVIKEGRGFAEWRSDAYHVLLAFDDNKAHRGWIHDNSAKPLGSLDSSTGKTSLRRHESFTDRLRRWLGK